MQLVLVDTWAAERSIYALQAPFRPEYFKFAVSQSTLSSEKLNLAAGDRVVKEIFSSPSKNPDESSSFSSSSYTELHLEVLLSVLTSVTQTWTVIISGSACKKMLDQFQGDVNLSVEIKYLRNNREIIDIASVTGMRMDCENCICVGKGTINLQVPFSLNYILEQVPPIHLKVFADVDDGNGNPTKKPRISGLNDYQFTNTSIAPRKILEEGSFSDVIITTAEGAKVNAHKAFLSVSSPVFKDIFENEMKDSQIFRLEMTDASEQGVKAYLRYVYYGSLEEPKVNIHIAFQLLGIARKYDMSNLEEEMIVCLALRRSEDFSVSMAFKIYMFIRNIEHAAELKEKTLRILKTKPDEVKALEEYKDLFLKHSNDDTVTEVFWDFAGAS